MAKIITIGNQKGGVGKSTTTAMLALVMSQKHRVLCIDMDPQANLTELITKRNYEYFDAKSILNALEDGNAQPYIVDSGVKGHTLHVIPSTDEFAVYKVINDKDYLKLNQLLRQIGDQYDYILIDTPPLLGDFLITSLLASDAVICTALTHHFAVSASVRFLKKVRAIRELKPQLRVLGVAVAILENTKKHQRFLGELRDYYKDLMFVTEIRKRSAIVGKTIHSFKLDRKKDQETLEQYIQLAEEITNRVQK